MRETIKKYFPERGLLFWRYMMEHKRFLKRYLYAGGDDFLKHIKINSLSFDIFINPVTNCCVDDVIAAEGIWEPEISNAILKYLPEGGTFVDVGANIGYHSLFAAALHNKKTRVFSFEPQKKLREMLKSSCKINDFSNVQVFPVALSDVPGTLDLSIPLENVGASSLVPSLPFPGKIRETVSVDVEIFDNYLDTIKNIDLIKIDVEGFELNVLKGSKKALQRNSPILILEFSPVIYKHVYKNLANELLDFLDDFGYQTLTLNGKIINCRQWLLTGDNHEEGQIDIICLPKN